MIFDLIICATLGFSLLANLLLALHIRKLPVDKKSNDMSYDAKALLRDLASGPALVKIEYLDRADVLLRSPRHFS